ncbi:hypothetical protein PF010_g32361 [Phytophthora fragariae]|uniref:Secreted protein n=1 Tax=Phytophthora fragariae TaxID=53985 RepID=A0A6G0JF58_9STRA|nr:hypothetical protein PF010_g32361 [Phytophthora fragariae]
MEFLASQMLQVITSVLAAAWARCEKTTSLAAPKKPSRVLESSTSSTQTSWARCRRRHLVAVRTLSHSSTISHVTSRCTS